MNNTASCHDNEHDVTLILYLSQTTEVGNKIPEANTVMVKKECTILMGAD